MFEHLVTILSNSWGVIAPFVIVNQYEKAVILRLGKYVRSLKPGLHFKIPMIENLLTVEAVQTTMLIQPQTLTTADDVSVMTSGAIQYEIRNAKLFLLDVYEGRDAIRDIALMEVKKMVQCTNWEDLTYHLIDSKLTLAIRRRVKEYGVHVKRFAFIDIGKIKTLRIIGGSYEPLE